MTMTAPDIAIALFVLLMLGGKIIAYLHSASVASLIARGTPGFGRQVGGLGVLKSKEFWLVFAPFLTPATHRVIGLRFSGESRVHAHWIDGNFRACCSGPHLSRSTL